MYFLLADLIHRFIYLKLGLSLVLVWVGIKMLLLVDIYKIPTTLSLAVVLAIIAISITASLVKTRGTTAPEFIGQEPHGTTESSSPPPQDVEGPAAGSDISADVATEPDAVVGVAGGSPVQHSTDSTEEEVVR
jgi:tellurite resistance protein TerC